jgi:uncharacterized membrane protein HdeD (DUF308 family)
VLRISPDGDVRHFAWQGGRAVEREMPVIAPDEEPARAARAQVKNPFQSALAAAKTLFPRPKKPERARWILLAQGALALALGIGAFVASAGRGATAGWRVLVTAFGVYALIDGALSFFGARREQPWRRLLSRVRGGAGLLLGLLVLRRGAAVEIFVVLVGVWAFVSGALRVAASAVLERMVDARWLRLVGWGSMIAGLVLLFWPTSSPLLKYALSAYLCYYGLGELLAGIFGQRLPRGAGSLKRALLMIVTIVAFAAPAGCGAVAQQAGRGAAEGAMGKLAAKIEQPDRFVDAAEAVKRRVIGGTLRELSEPERLHDVRRMATALGAGVIAGAAKGARVEELAPLFPECGGVDASTCLDRAVARVSGAAAAGVTREIRASLGVWPLVIAFGLGALTALSAVAIAKVAFRAAPSRAILRRSAPRRSARS